MKPKFNRFWKGVVLFRFVSGYFFFVSFLTGL